MLRVWCTAKAHSVHLLCGARGKQLSWCTVQRYCSMAADTHARSVQHTAQVNWPQSAEWSCQRGMILKRGCSLMIRSTNNHSCVLLDNDLLPVSTSI